MTPDDIDRQLRKQSNQTTDNEMSDKWDITFEEGVLKSDINEDALPKDENTAENHGFFCIKLIHTQWRYDLNFVTPTGTSYNSIFYINAIFMARNFGHYLFMFSWFSVYWVMVSNK